jgi:hypothetical protein
LTLKVTMFSDQYPSLLTLYLQTSQVHWSWPVNNSYWLRVKGQCHIDLVCKDCFWPITQHW